MATSSLKKSFVISSKSEASKLVKMYSDSLVKTRVASSRVNAPLVSSKQLKEIVKNGFNK